MTWNVLCAERARLNTEGGTPLPDCGMDALGQVTHISQQ